MLQFFIVPLLFINTPMPEYGKITVTIEGIAKDKGTMIIGLFDCIENFNVSPVKYFKEPVKGRTTMTVVFTDVPFREYAVSVYQDLNESGELDKNIFGVPTEPYGFSNNPKIITGPSYEKSTFILDRKEINMKIRLR